jgi:hypothetical protein
MLPLPLGTTDVDNVGVVVGVQLARFKIEQISANVNNTNSILVNVFFMCTLLSIEVGIIITILLF